MVSVGQLEVVMEHVLAYASPKLLVDCLVAVLVLLLVVV